MLRATVHYSIKVPGEVEYSSEGYALSLEKEIFPGDADYIQAQIHDTFALVKATVEAEQAGVTPGNVVTLDTDVTHNREELRRNAEQAEKSSENVVTLDTRHVTEPRNTRDEQRTPRGIRKASSKQISYINSLVGSNRIPLSELIADIQHRFNAKSLYDLTSKEASEIIDELTAQRKPRKAA